jgi:methionine-rich copper-binding protein CopC
MTSFRLPLSALVAAAFVASVGSALAHADLIHSSPAANATIASPEKIELHFSDVIAPRLSVIKLTRDGADIITEAAATRDAKGVIATPETNLEPGVYTLTWTVVSPHDAHKMTGNFKFTVK